MAVRQRDTPTETVTVEMEEVEEAGDYTSEYARLARGASLVGKRLKGEGKIVAETNPRGELHPTYFRIEGSDALPTLDEILTGMHEFDGRHNFQRFETVDD
jgi:hypothetical protein